MKLCNVNDCIQKTINNPDRMTFVIFIDSSVVHMNIPL